MRLSLCTTLALCLAASVRADDFDYLPDNFQVYISMDVGAVAKHQAIADLKKRLPIVEKKFDAEMQQNIGVGVSDIANFKMAVQLPELEPNAHGDIGIAVLTLHKPTTWAEIKGRFKASKFKVEVSYEEMKIGKYTVFQEKYKYNFGGKVDEQFQTGQFFCLPKENVLIFGSRAALKVLERGTPAKVSPAMQQALKAADANQTIFLAYDIQGTPTHEKKNMKRDTPFPGFGDAVDSADAVLVQGKLGDKLQVSATAFSKNEAGAAGVKKFADESMAAAKFMLADNEKLPKEARDLMKETRTLLGTVKTTVVGAQAKAEVAVDPTLLIRLLEMTAVSEQRGDVVPPAQPVPTPPK